MSSCPTCGKPVDALRAPAVRVTAGKVVGYCSKECASAAESQPVRAPAAAATPVPAKAPAAKTKTPAKGVPASPADLDSGPVIQVIHEPATGVVTSAADARQGRARSNPRAETDGAIQIADTGHIDDYVSYDEPSRSKVLLVVLLLVLVVAGVGAAGYFLGYFDKYLGRSNSVATQKTVETQKPEPVAVDAPPPLTPEVAIEKAKAVLRANLTSTPRVQRVAASALARTGDKQAVDTLASLVGKDSSASVNREVAYALARAGDKRGLDALVAESTGDREDRHDGGRYLAQLGDKRAIKTLQGSLQYEQFRLSVAESLAPLADPQAIEVLEKVRKDDKASAAEKARATIALVRAGRTDAVPEVKALLADSRNNLPAAEALAELHDEAARPVLVNLLGINALRVRAARALRRLAPDADTSALLPPLVAALDSQKDIEQIQVAEAILLLAGPATWSEHE